MSRRLMMTLLVLAMLPMMAFASFIQVGPTATYHVPVDFAAETPVDLENIDWGDYKVGADLRLNFFGFLQADAAVNGKFNQNLELSVMDCFTSANLRFKLFFLDATVGGGLKTAVTSEDGLWKINGEEDYDFERIVNSSSLFYRLGASMKLGKISLAASAFLPVDLTVNQMNEPLDGTSIFEALTPDLSKTEVSVGLLLNFF